CQGHAHGGPAAAAGRHPVRGGLGISVTTMSRAVSSPTRDARPAASSATRRGRPFGSAKGECAMSASVDALPASPVWPRPADGLLAAPSGRPSSLVTWYLGLIPHWMGAKPPLRCRLLLRTHQWIVDRVLAPEVGLAAALGDLRPGGALTEILSAMVPASEGDRWAHFIQVVVANLRHALLLPVARRNEAWIRGIF